MEEKTLHILEFDKVIEQLSQYATSDAGRSLCRKLTPSSNPRKVREWLKNTSDACDRIRLKGRSLSFRGVRDLGDSIARLSVSAALSAPELLSVSSLLTAADRAVQYGQSEENEERRDSLTDLFTVLSPLPQINRELKRCILSEDEISDDASPELSRIRRQQKQAASKIHDSLSGLINSYRDYLSDAVITQRDGRYCLPVRAESKAKVPGIVHDTSSTGMTLFIEPGLIVKLNNDLRELEVAEKKEIERILEELSLSLTPYVEELKENIRRLRQLDMIFAKALYAASIGGVPLWSGYVSKTLLHEGIVEYISAGGAHAALCHAVEVLFLASGGMTLTYMTKLYWAVCWEKHPRSPEVILALAQLYDENLNQPMQAWFFYEEYLKNPPAGADLTLVRNARDLVRLRLGRLLEKDSAALAELQKENASLRSQLALLRRYVTRLRSRPRPPREPELAPRPSTAAPAR